jgi:P27 family predicted phage terminase small subunit
LLVAAARGDDVRGRPPKPREQRVLEGNPGKRPLPEPVVLGGRPDLKEMIEPPSHLHPDAKDFWKDSVVRLVEVGILDRVDTPALEQLATQYARIRAAQRVIDEAGYFARGSTGQIKEHPALKIEERATNLFLKLAEHYGLTAIARTRLGLAELHRRSLAQELTEGLGVPELRPAKRVEPTLTSDDPDEIERTLEAQMAGRT